MKVPAFLAEWISDFEPRVFRGRRGPENLVASLSVEYAPLSDFVGHRYYAGVRAFRKLSFKARMSAARTALGRGSLA